MIQWFSHAIVEEQAERGAIIYIRLQDYVKIVFYMFWEYHPKT